MGLNNTFRQPVIHVRDEQLAATASGAFSSGAWRTRVLNTVVVNEIEGASLASNQVTIPAGTYDVEAYGPVYRVDSHQLRLRNITDGTDLEFGQSSYASGASISNDTATMRGRFTITGTKVIELQHRCNTTRGTDGFGAFGGWTTEVFASLRLTKVG